MADITNYTNKSLNVKQRVEYFQFFEKKFIIIQNYL